MDPSQWQEVQEAFLAAVSGAPDAREAALARGCRGDLDLRAEVESLLDAHERAAGFIDIPAFDLQSRADDTEESGTGVGQRISRYTLRRILGAGGMGVVWEADQEQPHRTVALKVIRPGLMTPEIVRRFEHEAETLARLQHPGIAHVYEAGTHTSETGTIAYFVMELVRGEPITTYAERRTLDVPDRLRLFIRVCEAVEHAHQKGIIHRDLKPGNILVVDGDAGLRANTGPRERPPAESPWAESEGTSPPSRGTHASSLLSAQPKVLDFGVARTVGSDVQATTLLTHLGQVVGTISYMSPEQVAGQPGQTDTRSDVYSLGVLLYELVSGRLPHDFSGKPLPEAARIIRDDAPTRLSSVRRGLRGDLETIISKALEKDPARRYATVSQLAADLGRFLRNEPISARPSSMFYHLRKLVVRHKTGCSLVATSFVVICGLTLYALRQAARATEQRDVAIASQRREVAERHTAEQVTAFLIRLFEQGDPGRENTTEPTVRDLVEAGVNRLDADLADQPLVYASLAHVLGAVYTRLADFPRASQLLESAVRIRRRELGDRHAEVADSLNALAETLVTEPERAHVLRLEALEICRAVYGPRHEQVAAALVVLGNERFYAGDAAGAADYFRQSLDMRLALGTPDGPEMGEVRHDLGSALQQLGQLDAAERELLTALDIKRRTAGGDVPSIGVTLEGLAQVAYARGDLDAAERYVDGQVAVCRQGLRANHPYLAQALNNQAFIAGQRRGSAAAVPIHREALATRRAALGNRHPEVAASLNELGLALLDVGDHEGAEGTLAEALSIRREHFGDLSALVAHSLNSLAHAYGQVRKFDQAAPLQLETLQIWRAVKGEDHALVGVAYQNLGFTLTGLGDVAGAAAQLHAAAEIYARQNHRNLGGAFTALGSLHWANGNFETAYEYYRLSWEVWNAVPGDDAQAKATALNGLGASLCELGRPAEAEPLLCEALETWRKAYPDGHGAFVLPLVNLGNVLSELGAAQGAEEVACEALDLARRTLDSADPVLAYAMALRGALRADRGDWADAEPLLREALAVYARQPASCAWQIARTESALGRSLARQGRKAEAEPLLRASHATLAAIHGEHHRRTVEVAQTLAALREKDNVSR